MVRAVGLLIAFVVLGLMFGDLHPWEFFAKQLAPPVRRVPPAPAPPPRPFDGYGANPMLKRNPLVPGMDPMTAAPPPLLEQK